MKTVEKLLKLLVVYMINRGIDSEYNMIINNGHIEIYNSNKSYYVTGLEEIVNFVKDSGCIMFVGVNDENKPYLGLYI